MKYIRTKDKEGKQYIISDREYIFLIRDNKVIFARGYKEELLGQADTIEELCDEFVLEMNEYFEYCIFKLFATAKALKLESVKNKEVIANIYGSIWTDKGLVYVAKMNDKGELELL